MNNDSLNSHPLFFTDKGHGKPVILLHGFLETHAVWDELSSQLSKDHQVLCFDLPGFGNSPSLHSNFSITDVARRVLQELRVMRVVHPILIGHSLGGYVALAMVEEDPLFFTALGLFHSTGYADTPEKKEARTKTIEFVKRNGAKVFSSGFIVPLFANPVHKAIPALINIAIETREETVLGYLQAMRERPDRTHVLKTFNGHILFIAGDKDSVIPYKTIEMQCTFAKKPCFVLLNEVGHMGMFEAPDQITEEIRRFIEKSS